MDRKEALTQAVGMLATILRNIHLRRELTKFARKNLWRVLRQLHRHSGSEFLILQSFAKDERSRLTPHFSGRGRLAADCQASSRAVPAQGTID
jgi:hypothetical protein